MFNGNLIKLSIESISPRKVFLFCILLCNEGVQVL